MNVDLKNVQQLAEEGDLAAQLELGKLRIGQERFEDAAVWLKRAAAQESPEAQCLLGSLLSEGLGVDQDFEAAAYWLRQAASQGHSGAQVLLAHTFESGQGVPVNHSMAAQWYRKAAEQGDAIAEWRYGELLRRGSGVEKNIEEAIQYLRSAAEKDCLEAQVELLECLIESKSANKDEIISWGTKAAEGGSAHAAYLLAGVCESSPNGISQAEQLYRKAAEQGHKDAQMRLATLYAEGKIVSQNPQEAEKWLDMAIARSAASESPVVADPAAKPASAARESAAHTAMSPHHDYPPGTILDKKYFIMSLLGKGGMCRVYKAKHLTMNRMVAIKMLLPELAVNESLVQRFEREAQAASALNHPNVITIYDLGTTADGKPYIVMDYLEGQSLDERIESVGMLPIDATLGMFIQVCAALNAAHEAGIIHRDIKPSNIMLTTGKTQTDVVKVVDFGLAKMLEPGEDNHKLTKTGEVFGTLLYMSPEQCLGHPLDVRTDIYSVGCAMYEALTGVAVFSAKSPFDLMSKHINTPPEPFGAVAPHVDCPLAVEAIIMKTLAKNRDERYQTIAELQQELEAELAKLRS